ncbi:MAG TPA: HNH endonuclease [Pyrinomonadaceae bacterium]|nr:HNH endonuclease [Pyrinomonadaceae bacterium]
MFARAEFPLDDDGILSFRGFKKKNEVLNTPKMYEKKHAGFGRNLPEVSEDELLKQINQGLSAELWRIYNDFLTKRRAEILAANEAETLAKISDDIEWINNHRLLLVIELAHLQNREIDEVVKSFVFKDGNQVENQLNPETKAFILENSEGVCEYCHSQAEYSFASYSIEMIVPTSKDGKVEVRNLALTCQGCSNHKYRKTAGFDAVSNETVELFNPRFDDWKKHFAWNEDASLLVGLTAKARATISELKLNRPTLIELRAILVKIGRHPFNIK